MDVGLHCTLYNVILKQLLQTVPFDITVELVITFNIASLFLKSTHSNSRKFRLAFSTSNRTENQ